jgi:hypothetical protein
MSPDLNDVDEQEWAELLARLMTVLAPTHTPEKMGTAE